MSFFRRNTALSSIENFTQEQIARMKKAIINVLCYVGESCLNEARLNGAYKDQTGNLRSSVGYVVLDNGKEVSRGGFKTSGSGSYGSAEGEKYIKDIMQKYKVGIVLIVVAGMKYAAHVEAKGLNVLTSSELKAEKLVPSLLNDLGIRG